MIEYRKTNINDVTELVRLRIEFLKETRNVQTDSNDSEIQKSLTEYFRTTLNNNSFIAWLALADGRIVGTSGLCFYTLVPSYRNLTGKVAYIMNMYTQPVYRHRGIATYLFQKMIDEAQNLGYQKLVLHASEQGRPLYQKFGFKNADNEMILNMVEYLG
ncbi:MAG: GNAT family N-acetyltransferase [Bacteroidota bacterium]